MLETHSICGISINLSTNTETVEFKYLLTVHDADDADVCQKLGVTLSYLVQSVTAMAPGDISHCW